VYSPRKIAKPRTFTERLLSLPEHKIRSIEKQVQIYMEPPSAILNTYLNSILFVSPRTRLGNSACIRSNKTDFYSALLHRREGRNERSLTDSSHFCSSQSTGATFAFRWFRAHEGDGTRRWRAVSY